MLWHLITGEYPPQPGGVADYTRLVAKELVRAGDEVHVWASHDSRPTPDDAGVTVHRLPDRFGPKGLRVLASGLRLAPKGRIVVQYVPHMYGYRAMNLALATWLRLWAPPYWVMFHEVAFPISRHQIVKHNILGIVNHVMATLVAGGAEKIFISVPRWETLLRNRCFVRRPMRWLPVPSNMPTEVDAATVARIRSGLITNAGGLLVGHFGTFDKRTAGFLVEVISRLLRNDLRRRAVMMGRGTEAFAEALNDSDVRDRIVALGDLPDRTIAEHLAACDVVLQPYLDGVSSRRGSAMASLALGRAIITNEGPSTEPLWRERGLVETAPFDDCGDFVRCGEAILSSPEVREHLGQRARLGYESCFSIQKTIEALRDQD